MKTHHKKSGDDSLRPISPVRARLLQVFGPAESWDNPLTGTRYDPGLRHRAIDERRHARQERRARRRSGLGESSSVEAEPETDHHTPDEA